MIRSQDPQPSPGRESVEALMREFARDTGADGITLWKAEEGQLIAIANPLEPAIIGMRQPLDRGLVSRVYLTGQAILEQTLKDQPHHDPTIDEALGTRGAAMMAAPVEAPAAGVEGGVISAVVLEGSRLAADFTFASLGRLSLLARELAKQWHPR